MISNPHVGQIVQIWYAPKWHPVAHYHGRIGVVTICGKGRPRNHLIETDGTAVCVPGGNLRKPQ